MTAPTSAPASSPRSVPSRDPRDNRAPRAQLWHRHIGYLALAILAYVPVLLSHAGKVAADTKQYLYLDPSRLLERAVSMWDPNIGLGTVTHQNIGYVFPMGPYYWLFDKVGVPDWIAQRIWLGSILFFAGLGMLYLLRTLDVRGVGAPVAALAYMFGPYALDYSARISVILLPFAALPWMLGLTIRALRRDRIGRWREPALFAVVVQIVGGVNATALIFAGVAPVLWILYAVAIDRSVNIRRALAVTWRIGLLTVLTSAWWIAGLSLQAGYGMDILRYTETVKTVARSSMAPEIFRGLGYWFFYGRDKLGPWIESAVSYTQSEWLIVVGYLVPCLALASAAILRWRHRIYFAIVGFVAMAIAVGAHPFDDPSPFGAAMKSFAAESSAGLALRSTGRAVPLLAMSLAVFLACGVTLASDALAARFGGGTGSSARRWLSALAVPLVVGGLVLANFPALRDGTYYGKNLLRGGEVPGYWEAAAEAIDGGDLQTRVLELPGADFASYRWGNLVDPVTPGITDRPYVARELIPWGSPASANLLNALDRRLQEGSLNPESIVPIARLLGAGAVVARNDLQVDRYNLVRPIPMKQLLSPPPVGLSAAQKFGTSLGPKLHYPLVDEIALGMDPTTKDPAPVEIYELADAERIVRAESDNAPLIVAGDGDGLVSAASVGLITTDGIVLYSASNAGDAEALRRSLDDDATLVVTDSNRKQALRWSTVRDNIGYTERADEDPLVEDASDARLDLFGDAGTETQTVMEHIGAKVQAANYGNPVSYTPEDRAAYSLDGDVETAWKVGAFAPVIGEMIRVEFDEPITTDSLNVVQPIVGDRDRYITKARLMFWDGKRSSTVRVALDSSSRTATGQTITFGKRRFDRLEITIDGENVGQRADYKGVSAVGFAEIRVRDRRASADVKTTEVVRMPVDLTDAVGNESHEHRLVYVMERQRVIPVPPRSDPELSLTRAFEVPTTRDFSLAGEARLDAYATDTMLDVDLGFATAAQGGIDVLGSSRLPGAIDQRASQAFDADPATFWSTGFHDPTGKFVDVTTTTPVTFDALSLQVVADGRHSVPTRLEIRAGGEVREVELPTIADGGIANGVVSVRTPKFEPITGDQVRITITGVRQVKTINYFSDGPIVMPVAIAEFGIAGMRRGAPVTGLLPQCLNNLVYLDGKAVPVRIIGSRDVAELRGALSLVQCEGEPPIRLSAGRHVLSTFTGRLSSIDVDRVTLASEAGGVALELGDRGSVPPKARGPEAKSGLPTLQVEAGRTRMTVRASDAKEPFELVLGQSINKGWHARIDGHDLGPARLVNGYANGWHIRPQRGATDFEIELEWTPQRSVRYGLAISGLALLACLALALGSGRLRSRRAVDTLGTASVEAVVTGRAWDDPSFGMESAGEHVQPSRLLSSVVGGVVVGIVVAIFVTPVVGLVLGISTVGAIRWRWLERGLRMLSPIALGLAGAYIVVQQLRFDYPPVFEWPSFFESAHVWGWVGAAALLASSVVEFVRTRSEEG